MAQTVTLTIEVVRVRLLALEQLYRDLDRVLPTVRSVKQRQGTGRWSSIPESVQFAESYRRTLHALHTDLESTRDRVDRLRVDLAASARSLGLIDEDIEARLGALATRSVELMQSSGGPRCV